MSVIMMENIAGDRLSIRFAYDEILVRRIKSVPGRKWNKEKNCWEIPLSSLKDLMDAFELSEESIPASVLRLFKEKYADNKTRLVVGNTYTRIIGTDLPMELLEDVTSFWIEGAEYSKMYKDGKWDGHHHLMRKRGGLAVPTGLISQVQEVLTRVGIDHIVDDQRRIPALNPPLPTFGHRLRDYQQEVLEVTKNKERGVLQLATGAGKTLIAAHLIASKAVPTLFFVHTKDLLYQTMRVFHEILRTPIGQIGDGGVDLQPVTVATIQTTARALHLKLKKEKGSDEEPLWKDEAGASLTITDEQAILQALKKCEMAIFDECHHLPADTFYEIAMKIPDAYYRYGLSATPWRSDHSDLMIEAALGPKLCVVNSTELVKKGYLVPPKITMYEVYPPRKSLSRKYSEVYQAMVVENQERNGLIQEIANHCLGRGKSVLILVNQIRHGEILESLIDGAAFIHGKDSSDVRNEALKQLREKTNCALIATTLADEGLDLPSLDVLILAGGGKSETRALQRVGRVLRPHPGKKTAVIVDFWDQCRFLEQHSRQRYQIYQTEPAFEIDIRPPRGKKLRRPRQKILDET